MAEIPVIVFKRQEKLHIMQYVNVSTTAYANTTSLFAIWSACLSVPTI
jgi:hypothetical protein